MVNHADPEICFAKNHADPEIYFIKNHADPEICGSARAWYFLLFYVESLRDDYFAVVLFPGRWGTGCGVALFAL